MTNSIRCHASTNINTLNVAHPHKAENKIHLYKYIHKNICKKKLKKIKFTYSYTYMLKFYLKQEKTLTSVAPKL